MIGSFLRGRPSTRPISSGVGVRPSSSARRMLARRHLREQLDHVGRNADRLGRVDQGPLDRLLDPVAGVGAEAGAHRRVEALDGPQQAQVALFDQVLQAEALAGVAAGDVDHQAEVGADHAVAGGRVAVADGDGQLALVVGRQERGLVDLAEVRLQRRLDGGGAAAARLGDSCRHRLRRGGFPLGQMNNPNYRRTFPAFCNRPDRAPV